MKTQILLLAALFSVAAVGWLSRDRVGTALAALSGEQAPALEGREGRAQKNGRKSGQSAVPVIVSKVDARANTASIVAIGSARARRSVMLFPKSDGEVMAFAASTGQQIKAGEEILRLDASKADLAVRLAEKTLEDTGVKLKRVEFLQNRNVNSGASVEDAKIAVARAEIELKQAQENLRDTRLTAPFAGILGIPKIEVGDRVTSTTEIVTLDDRSELYVEFEVPEEFIARIAVGNRVTATTPSYGNRSFEGRLGFIDTRVDPTSRALTVRAVFPNTEDLLRPGMSFAVKLELPGEIYPAVPELALQWQQGESFVWLVKEGKAQRVVVETIRRLNNTILVEGPVSPGDLIVVEGVQRVRPNVNLSFEPRAATPAETEPVPSTSQTAPRLLQERG